VAAKENVDTSPDDSAAPVLHDSVAHVLDGEPGSRREERPVRSHRNSGIGALAARRETVPAGFKAVRAATSGARAIAGSDDLSLDRCPERARQGKEGEETEQEAPPAAASDIRLARRLGHGPSGGKARAQIEATDKLHESSGLPPRRQNDDSGRFGPKADKMAPQRPRIDTYRPFGSSRSLDPPLSEN
jgi:hypothetical protein